MKKKIVNFLAIAVSCASVFSACSPAGMSGGEEDGRTRLYVSVYKAGYGISWLENIAKEYEKTNPNVKVVFNGDAAMEQVAQAALESNNADAVSDIFSCISYGNYYQNVINDRLENLDGLYETVVEGTDTVGDIADADFVQTLTVNNSKYAVPWMGTVSGIVYNKGMFDSYGWEVPTTINEYYALCDKICRESDVYPLGYCGGAVDGYMMRLFEGLSFQHDGKTAMENFFKGESADIYKNPGRLEAYKAIGRMITGEGKNASGKAKTWVLPGSKGFGHLEIEQEFIKGKCAMMVGGAWFRTEMAEFLKDYPNFSAAMMPNLWLTDEKTSLDGGTQTANSNSATMFVVPKLAKNKDLAKDFLRFMYKKEMRKIFVESTFGTPMVTTYEGVDLSGLDSWSRSVMDIYNNSFSIFGYSENEKFRKGQLKTIMANDGQICNAFNGSLMTPTQSDARAKSLFDNDYATALNYFN